MKEAFLNYLWAKRLIREPLETVEGESLVVIDPGIPNTDAGPDFFNARIKIGATIWAGNVEVHVNASDWNRHGHQRDRKYNNIILHIVYKNDTPIINSSGKAVATLELQNRFDIGMLHRYNEFSGSRWWIPCANLIAGTNENILKKWFEEMQQEKIILRAEALKKTLVMNNYDWNQSLYVFLASGFGFHVNSIGFEMLAKSVPFQVVGELKNDITSCEALLFGQAGLLKSSYTEDYPRKLWLRYNEIKREYHLEPVDPKIWNFLRLRPSNFPTIRIAQFASLLSETADLHSGLINLNTPKSIFRYFDVFCSPFWTGHYTFDRTSRPMEKRLGKSAILSLAINIIVPLIYLNARFYSRDGSMKQALDLLRSLPAENNHIVRKFEGLGIPVSNAGETQAMIHMKKKFCDKKKCLDCGIGQHLIRNSAE